MSDRRSVYAIIVTRNRESYMKLVSKEVFDWVESDVAEKKTPFIDESCPKEVRDCLWEEGIRSDIKDTNKEEYFPLVTDREFYMEDKPFIVKPMILDGQKLGFFSFVRLVNSLKHHNLKLEDKVEYHLT